MTEKYMLLRLRSICEKLGFCVILKLSNLPQNHRKDISKADTEKYNLF